MSAFIISKEHIDCLVTYAVFKRLHCRVNDRTQADLDNADEIGQLLVNENYRSYNYLYNDENINPYVYSFTKSPKYSLIQIIKACNCYNYQSCETDDYYQSDAYYLVDNIIKSCIMDLPGYEESMWEIRV